MAISPKPTSWDFSRLYRAAGEHALHRRTAATLDTSAGRKSWTN